MAPVHVRLCWQLLTSSSQDFSHYIALIFFLEGGELSDQIKYVGSGGRGREEGGVDG